MFCLGAVHFHKEDVMNGKKYVAYVGTYTHGSSIGIHVYDIDVEKINISKELEIKLYLGNVRVELGTDENLSDKIMDLRDIMPNLGDASGVLDMKVLDVHGNGYTLKRD
jgi:hypothetical protein